MFERVWVCVDFGYFGGLDLLLVICWGGAVFVVVACWFLAVVFVIAFAAVWVGCGG